MTPVAPDEPGWRVVCLCAAWCRVCEAYQPVFEALARRHPEVVFRWLDIEDEADVLGDLDVETFPCLLVLEGRCPRFFGPLLPQPEPLERLLAALRASPGGPPVVSLSAAWLAHFESRP